MQNDVYILEGCRQLYEASGDNTYQDFLIQKMNTIINSGGSVSVLEHDSENYSIYTAGAGRCFIWLAEHSKQEKYKTAVERQISMLKAQCRESSVFHQPDGRLLYLTQPFYMEYESKYHNKAEYKDIVNLLALGQKADTDSLTAAFMEDILWYLMALVDVISCMSIEIYEHYRFLEENLKRIIRQFVHSDQGLSEGFSEILSDEGIEKKNRCCSMLGYVILKACNQKNLNSEKYGAAGKKLVEQAADSLDFGKNCKNNIETGLLMMAYAQFLLFRGDE